MMRSVSFDDMMGMSAEGSLGPAIKTSAVVWFLQETDAVLEKPRPCGSFAR